jgi:hypothetical protein
LIAIRSISQNPFSIESSLFALSKDANVNLILLFAK